MKLKVTLMILIPKVNKKYDSAKVSVYT